MSNLLRPTFLRFALSTSLMAALAAQPAVAGQGPSVLQLPDAQTRPSGATLPLSMEAAVVMALETNLGLRAERLNLDVAAEDIASARAAFLPQVGSSVRGFTVQSVPLDFTQGSADITSRGLAVNGGLGQALPWYGGRFDVTWSGNRNSQEGGISSFNPRLGSTLSVNFSQPLLRNFRLDANRYGLDASERRRTVADIQLQGRIVATDVAVRLAYLNLVAALEGLNVAQQNMDIQQQSLENARARVRVGTAPQIDIIQAEAQVASQQELLILAQAQIATMEDQLRTLILDPGRTDYWAVRIEPTDSILLTPRAIDLDAAIRRALDGRLDLQARRRNLEIADLGLDLGRNATLPSVDLTVNYTASGTGGTQLVFGPGFPPPVVSRTDRSFGSVLGDTFGGAYPAWTVGVTVGYPLGRNAADAAYASQQIQKRQQEIGIRDLEIQIVREVREAARQVENSFERVQATRAARLASEQQLQAEERRFEVGLSTTLDLQIRQSQLASARVSELNAMIAYNRALITFDRVQKTQ